MQALIVLVSQQNLKEAVLPLIDSHAQHLIQKRITVEKLSSWCVQMSELLSPLPQTSSFASSAGD